MSFLFFDGVLLFWHLQLAALVACLPCWLCWSESNRHRRARDDDEQVEALAVGIQHYFFMWQVEAPLIDRVGLVVNPANAVNMQNMQTTNPQPPVPTDFSESQIAELMRLEAQLQQMDAALSAAALVGSAALVCDGDVKADVAEAAALFVSSSDCHEVDEKSEPAGLMIEPLGAKGTD